MRSAELPRRSRERYVFMAEPTVPETRLGRAYQAVRRVLIGRPLQSSQAIHERLSRIKALPVFSSDAISSTAYGTEESLIILVAAGAAAYNMILPIGIAIAILLAVLIFSYRQTIFAYPQGGGSYIVTKDNLGTVPSLIAASSLMVDYTLTVAVSISSGVAAITSAFESLYPFRVELAVAAIVFITIANLRGIREAGSIFAIPTYLFIVSMAILILLGIASWLGIGPTPHQVTSPIPQATHSLTLFLVLRAFSSGCSALTGVEAISDGVPAFKPPEAKNAATTLVWMGLILGSIFLGVTFLAHHFQLVPSADETIISQMTRTLVSRSPFYYIVQAATAGILLIAANTSFADFPRLGSFLARDRFLPHQFLFRGDRLAYSTGITVLAVAAGILVILFKASVTALIPLYAVGVFVSFTLSQSSMTYRWWKKSVRGHKRTTGMLINGTGATVTAIVAVIIILTKFLEGAWIVILVIPLVILLLLGIRRHYDNVAAQLAMSPGQIRAFEAEPVQTPVVAVPIDSLNQASMKAIRYAQRLSNDVTVIHVTDELDAAETLRRRWAEAQMTLPLVIIEAPYRELIGPLVSYIEQLHREKGGAPLTVVLPEFVPAHFWELLLHNQTAWRLRTALWTHRGIVVTSVPYHLQR